MRFAATKTTNALAVIGGVGSVLVLSIYKSRVLRCEDTSAVATLPEALLGNSAIVVAQQQIEEFDPFHLERKLTFYECLKLVFGAWYMVPLRAMIIFPCILAGYVLTKLSTLGLERTEDGYPIDLPKWRVYAFSKPIQWLTRLVLLAGGFFSIKVVGTPALPSEAPILVCNHISYIDPMIFVAMQPTVPSFIAKASVAKLPLISTYAQDMCRCLYVDRSDASSRTQVLTRLLARVRSKDINQQVLIFPEGTVSNGSALISFRQGAFAAGLPIQPVCIRYPHSHFNPAMPRGVDAAWSMFWMLCQFVNRAELIYLPVYHPSPEEVANPTLYANNVRALIAKTLNIIVTEHTFAQALDLPHPALSASLKEHVRAH